tara:strand:- start:211 stop:549 length:339 start_codon:yes stop_codon:yes gene_type:complete
MMVEQITKPTQIQDLEVEFTDPCMKEFGKLTKKDNKLRKITEKIIDELRLNPYAGEKLYANFPGCRSIHYLGNKYRIIYQLIEESATKITIQCIGHRKNAYSKLAKWTQQGK